MAEWLRENGGRAKAEAGIIVEGDEATHKQERHGKKPGERRVVETGAATAPEVAKADGVADEGAWPGQQDSDSHGGDEDETGENAGAEAPAEKV
jgi:hypothetical protein